MTMGLRTARTIPEPGGVTMATNAIWRHVAKVTLASDVSLVLWHSSLRARTRERGIEEETLREVSTEKVFADGVLMTLATDD